MPFTRSTYPVRAPQRETKIVYGRFLDGGVFAGDGVTSVTDESSAGVYTIKFDGRGGFSDVVLVATTQGATAEDLNVQITGVDLAAREVEVTVRDATVERDLAGTEAVHFAAFIKDA